MLFNSFSFALFLPVVFLLYWFVFNKTLSRQNILLLVASYFFYACWDWRFMFLLLFSTTLDYVSGIKIAKSNHKAEKKIWFWSSIIINLGFLAVFKYYNFFSASFAHGLEMIGLHVNVWSLNVILPVGISFYTFHGLSYIIDIYYNRIPAEKNFVDYAVFVSFFPLLVAGPIERATHLLPQIKRRRYFVYSDAVDGCRQILWGLFKKMVIADNCAGIVNNIFENYHQYSGSTLIVGAVFFAIQIYCDFSGYSDIALGTARLFGISLLRNFAFPYFSRSIAEFWRRWHISLSSWFRDYLYFPLGGSKGSTLMKVRNTFIIFLVSGFWHGANWTFIIWGFLNALYIMPSIIFKTNRMHLEIVAANSRLPSLKELLNILLTFSLTTFAWIFFRAENVHIAFGYIKGIFNHSLISIPNFSGISTFIMLYLLIALFFLIEWIGRKDHFALQKFATSWHKIPRRAFYFAAIIAICYYGLGISNNSFIYFQF